MHMNSAPHLLNEDRAEYQRVLDEALRNAHERPDLAAVGLRLNAEQLRTMALNATALIAASAAAEYEHYVKVRRDMRTSTAATSVHGSVLSPAVGRSAEDGGAGFAAVIAVLAPLLAGTAALIFLLVGYILKMLSPTPSFADALLTAGWFFGALTAAAILVAAVGLLLTALRNGAAQVAEEVPAGELPDEVSRAKEAWAPRPSGAGDPALPEGGPRRPQRRSGVHRTAAAGQPDPQDRFQRTGLLQPRGRVDRRTAADLHQPGLHEPRLRRARTPSGVISSGRTPGAGWPVGPRGAKSGAHLGRAAGAGPVRTWAAGAGRRHGAGPPPRPSASPPRQSAIGR
ncbi:hypothetical protein [Streptomyces pristinaespiralis]|uniref:hypothetical protein n=1 Tax=Streptomyces pristinaespiralis TaxID=38300 RepID=UPI00383979AF